MRRMIGKMMKVVMVVVRTRSVLETAGRPHDARVRSGHRQRGVRVRVRDRVRSSGGRGNRGGDVASGMRRRRRGNIAVEGRGGGGGRGGRENSCR